VRFIYLLIFPYYIFFIKKLLREKTIKKMDIEIRLQARGKPRKYLLFLLNFLHMRKTRPKIEYQSLL